MRSEDFQFGLAREVKDRIVSVFVRYKGIHKVWIYGSRAKGNFRKGSDIDLCIQGHLDLTQLLNLRSELDDLNLPYQIDLSLWDFIENSDLLEHIKRCGQVIWMSSTEN